jgi:hypothetical protein
MSVPMTSNSCEWATPERLYRVLDSRYYFTVDACAAKWNAKVDLRTRTGMLAQPRSQVPSWCTRTVM